jgi:peptidoglycan/LPS O-acetylase OafA/YrhL
MTRRVEYLEGLRGVAAIQVVLLHFVSAFLPDQVDHAFPPLRVLFDGHTAVYVFFLISGAVLTQSFARGGPLLGQAAKRLVRLGVPVIAAAVLALVLIALLPQAHRQAAALSGSAWLAMDSSAAPTLPHLLREATLDSLLLGYREYTVFAPIADQLPLLEHALNAPSWSLHLELYGSLLVLALVRLRLRSATLHHVALVLCVVGFGSHPMFLFVIGHLCGTRLSRAACPILGASLIGLGFVMSASKDWALLETMRTAIIHVSLAAAPSLFQWQSQLAAVALFLGVSLSPTARAVLAHRICVHLGRLSFGIYLVHFPILFTLGCAGFITLAQTLAYPVAVSITFALFAATVLVAATSFERFVDRPAIRLSRLVA